MMKKIIGLIIGLVLIGMVGVSFADSGVGIGESGPVGSGGSVGGFSDPMTTRGDIIYKSSSATTRLPLGANGLVLKSDGIDISWQSDATGAGSGAFSDAADPVVLNTPAKNVEIGDTGVVLDAKLQIGGDTDEVQLIIEGHSVQTDSIFIIQQDAETQVVNIENDGTILTAVGLDGIGAIDMDYGSADITDHTFVTDGIGTAEVVLPAGSIDSTEILNDTIVNADINTSAAIAASKLSGVTTPTSTDTLTNKTINTASNAITIVEADIADLSHTTDTNTQLTQEQVEDFAGGMVGNVTGTHTGITITYQDITGDMDFTTDVTASSTNTFTNKTFDANGTGNSITNIENTDIAAGAAISVSKTALTAGTNITLSTDTLNVDDSFLLNTGDIGTGAYDFGGAVVEIPNGTSGTTDATGEIFFDTNGDTTNTLGDVVQMYNGVANKYMFPVSMPLAASQDNFILKYDASGKTIQWEADAGAAGGDSVSIDSVSVVDPDFVSTGDIDFVDTANTVTANINTGVIVNADVNASAAIVISKTALVAGTNITLSTNTLNVDDAFVANTGGDIMAPKLTISDSVSTAPLNLTERSAAPSSPATHDVYMDDGTNTTSGNPGLRRYTGVAWEDINLETGGAGDITAVGDSLSGAAFTADGTGNSLVFEGSTVDAFETTLTVEDPTTLDKTVTIPNATGTIVLKDTTDTLTNKTINTASNTITVVEADISDLAHTTDTNTQLTQEQVEDFAGALITDGTGTHTRVTITYQDITGDMDIVVDDMNDDVPESGDFGAAGDLNADGTITDGNITEADLKAVNVAVDEDILTYEVTTGDYEWHTPTELGLITAETDPNVDTEAEIEAITGVGFGASKSVTSGNIHIADGVDFESVAMSGDVAIASGGATTIQANSVALTTDTTGNYVTSITNGSGITGGDGGGEGSALTIAATLGIAIDTTEITDATIDQVDIDDTDTIAANPTNPINSVWFSTTGLIAEGATADAIETLITFADPTVSDKTITFPNETGTIVTSATTTGTNTGDQTINTADIADVSVIQTELAELETIGTTTISANQWTTLGSIAETLTSTELNLLDGITVLSGSNTGDNTVATSGDSATAFFSVGTIEHERGGLEADVSGYVNGLYGMASGVTTDIDTLAELNTAIASGLVTGAHTTDTFVTNKDSHDHNGGDGAAIPVAALANGTDGELITWSATGVAATVGVGASGEVLTSNGVGAAPTFQAGGGGGASAALDNLASVAINTSLIPDTDSIDNLGSTTKAWNNVYTDNIKSITGNDLTITPIAEQNLAIVLSGAGNLIVNTDDWVVDTSTGRVGVGTSTQAQALSVGSESGTALTGGGGLSVSSLGFATSITATGKYAAGIWNNSNNAHGLLIKTGNAGSTVLRGEDNTGNEAITIKTNGVTFGSSMSTLFFPGAIQGGANGSDAMTDGAIPIQSFKIKDSKSGGYVAGLWNNNSNAHGLLIKAGGTNNVQFKVQDYTSTADYFTVKSDKIGINTASPGNPLVVNRSADGVIVDFASAGIVEGNVSISGSTTSYNAFVGSHYTQLKDGQFELPVGAVVISTGEIIPSQLTSESKTVVTVANAIEEVGKNYAIEEVEVYINEDTKEDIVIGYEYDIEANTEKEIKKRKRIKKKVMKKKLKDGIKWDKKNRRFYKEKMGYIVDIENNKAHKITKNITSIPNKEYFVYIDTTTKKADKRVYGTWLGKMSDNTNGMSFGKNDKPVYLVAQVGLFKIRVTDTNGDIENGDYLETSTRSMEAQRQNSNKKLNSTIAKSMIDVKWEDELEDVALGYKWKLIPCTY